MAKLKVDAEIGVCFEPIGSRVVVRRDDSSEISPGGILLPGKAQERAKLGTVIAVGPGPRLHDGTYGKLQIVAGDRVVIYPFAETIEISGEEYVLVREEDVLAIVRSQRLRVLSTVAPHVGCAACCG